MDVRHNNTMNDLKKSKNYAVSKGPVNRRTAPASPAAKPAVAQSVRARIQMARAKHRLGTPLAQRLTTSGQNPLHEQRPTAIAIMQAIVATMSATGLVLGLIQNSVLWMGTSAVPLVSTLIWVYLSHRAQHENGDHTVLAVTDVVEAEDLKRLDAVLETMAAQASPITLDHLASLKESLARCMLLMTGGRADASPSNEESLYIREAVRRYIPDSINSCLQVPQKNRSDLVIEGSKPALDLLHEQLEMIRGQLDQRENRLTQAAGEALMRQQRFLAAKATSHI